MQVFKRSELTPEMLRQWEREAASEWIIETANSIFDLSMSIAEKTGGKVDIRENGEIWVDGWPYSYWHKQGEKYIHYLPGSSSAGQVKIIRGPWN